MTRINVIHPAHLTDQHLLAEYRELPRVFALARPITPEPTEYTLGKGHVRFFYTRTRYLSRRQAALIRECLTRGFNIQHTTAPDPVPGCDGDWTPTIRAARINIARLDDKVRQRPRWYTWHGTVVPDGWYNSTYSAFFLQDLE